MEMQILGAENSELIKKKQVIAADNGKWRTKKKENDAAVRMENEESRGESRE